MARARVSTLNVNGLRSAERRGFRDWLARSSPDVLCLQEIRCDEESAPADLWRPEGWSAAWTPAEKKGYAGTAVWARDPGATFERGLGQTEQHRVVPG
jgi:exodeoxyribonuclease-3